MENSPSPSTERKSTRFAAPDVEYAPGQTTSSSKTSSHVDSSGTSGKSFILSSPGATDVLSSVEAEPEPTTNMSGFIRGIGNLYKRRSTTTAHDSSSAPRSTSEHQSELITEEEGQIIKRRCRCCVASHDILEGMSLIVNSRVWGVLVFLFTVVLLFGDGVQDLWCPPESDTTFDVMFTLAFVVLLVDVILRSYVDTSYFLFHFRGRDFRSGGKGELFKLGSFMFWCDLISTLTLLYDMSFVNPRKTEIFSIDIVLNMYDIPTSGLEEVNKAVPIEFENNIIIAIARTTRVARFIQASAVVKTSSKLNWYWLPQHLSPMFYYRWLINRKEKHAAAAQEETTKKMNSTSISWLDVVSLTKFTDPPPQHESPRGLNGLVQSFLGMFGMGSKAEYQARKRYLAATKIQRAWRKKLGGGASPLAEANASGGMSTRSIHEKNSLAASRHKKETAMQRRSMHRSSIHRNSAITAAAQSQNRSESQVGSAMRELTGQRVALGIILALFLTVLFTYKENDGTRPSTMIVLHNQTQFYDETFHELALDAARGSSIPDLYFYEAVNGKTYDFSDSTRSNPEEIREREKQRVTVTDAESRTTTGLFVNKSQVQDSALIKLISTIFVLLIWFFGVTAFAGPVMILVVIPIERMIRLLAMLMKDPLGYQGTKRYKKFVGEEDEFIKNTRWTKDVLKGMETSFLMSTILRIGSLMKVGFGSAGVEIIQKNLQKGQQKDLLFLNSQGSTVSCIFLFCDIRQFTDATECLQEEVFVFTNKIAGVVHSICHSYGGSANKNVGDAFLLSWLLDDGSAKTDPRASETSSHSYTGTAFRRPSDRWSAKQNQADKALYSVVKIAIALQHDAYYLDPLSEKAQTALKKKLAKRSGPIVQMGFGLHAGKAVQGAIGSQRKLDATYVSEAVEFAEFLESSTKKYGIKMLMSGAFYRLLHPSVQRRCRKVDQIVIHSPEEDDNSDDGIVEENDKVELYTFDMDIEALWRPPPPNASLSSRGGFAESDAGSEAGGIGGLNVSSHTSKGSKRDVTLKGKTRATRRRVSVNAFNLLGSIGAAQVELEAEEAQQTSSADMLASGMGAESEDPTAGWTPPELVLPTGAAFYNANVWVNEDMRKLRQLYSDGLFFQKFNQGLQSFYARDWEHARQCFQTISDRFEDGPSRYFLNEIEKHDGVPPRNFPGFGSA